MAEREGFEPPIALRLCLISSQVHSTGLCHLSVRAYIAHHRLARTVGVDRFRLLPVAWLATVRAFFMPQTRFRLYQSTGGSVSKAIPAVNTRPWRILA